jgi:hypothetical protein
MSPVGRGGGEVAVGISVEPPAALMDGPVVGSADQDQVGQVGRAAVQPVDQMMGLTPGQRPGTAGKATAAVTHGQGGPLGRLHDSAGPPHVQGLGGGATQDRGQQGQGGVQVRLQPLWPLPPGGRAGVMGYRPGIGGRVGAGAVAGMGLVLGWAGGLVLAAGSAVGVGLAVGWAGGLGLVVGLAGWMVLLVVGGWGGG